MNVALQNSNDAENGKITNNDSEPHTQISKIDIHIYSDILRCVTKICAVALFEKKNICAVSVLQVHSANIRYQ